MPTSGDHVHNVLLSLHQQAILGLKRSEEASKHKAEAAVRSFLLIKDKGITVHTMLLIATLLSSVRRRREVMRGGVEAF